MSKHRVVKSDFWVDDYVESLQVKERYFFLYLLTNPNTNILGIYQNTLKRMSFETDLDSTTVENILHKFSKDDKVHFIDNYILMVNFQTHQNPNDKMKTGINKLFNSLSDSVIEFIYSKKSKIYDRLRIGYPIAYVYLHKDININKGKDKSKKKAKKEVETNGEQSENIKWVIDYLNSVLKTSYTYTAQKTTSVIMARLNDGYKGKDFKTVIDKKFNQWAGTDDSVYLRPETLFGSKFEGYLNQLDKSIKPDSGSKELTQEEINDTSD